MRILHLLKRCKKQNLDPRNLTNGLKEEIPNIREVAKRRLQHGVEIVADGMGNRLVLITVAGTEKRKRGIYGRNKTTNWNSHLPCQLIWSGTLKIC